MKTLEELSFLNKLSHTEKQELIDYVNQVAVGILKAKVN